MARRITFIGGERLQRYPSILNFLQCQPVPITTVLRAPNVAGRKAPLSGRAKATEDAMAVAMRFPSFLPVAQTASVDMQADSLACKRIMRAKPTIRTWQYIKCPDPLGLPRKRRKPVSWNGDLPEESMAAGRHDFYPLVGTAFPTATN